MIKTLCRTLKSENIMCGYLYFYVHFIIEVVCFFYLSRITENSHFIWLIPFVYDSIAFVPQGLIGYLADKFPKLNVGVIGVMLTVLSYAIYCFLDLNVYISLIILSLGNACIHISGALGTLKSSRGKLSHPAIFVGGGSFGVITGRLLARTKLNAAFMIPLAMSMIPFIFLAKEYIPKDATKTEFDYATLNLNPFIIVLLATLVVIVRGYMGYGIPTSWNKTTLQTVMLFFTMGIGKCLGGILSDAFGIRKVGLLSVILAIPFLIIGDDLMFISLFGVMLFSMTMAITLGIIASVYKENPGLAFGFTTIGLFLGTAPIFFISITNKVANSVMIIVLSLMCAYILSTLLKRGEKND